MDDECFEAQRCRMGSLGGEHFNDQGYKPKHYIFMASLQEDKTVSVVNVALKTEERKKKCGITPSTKTRWK